MQKAWKIIQDVGNGGGWDFLYDDCKFFTLDYAIKEHDKSKLSIHEFNAYREKFYPTSFEKEKNLFPEETNFSFEKAWEHHKLCNKHHWQNWTKSDWSTIDVVDNFCDWFAMSMNFGGKPLDYYRKENARIILPDYPVELMHEMEAKVIAKG